MIIASNRPFKDRVASNPKELDGYLKNHKVKRIYFPFWSWRVPDEILAKYECIGFHSTPLPRGRGGSPIQNMIRLGYGYTQVCMFNMTKDFDKGEVLKRTTVSLSGKLSEIISRITSVIESMIYSADLFDDTPATFKRITDNTLPETDTLSELYNEIRMRDEEGHPKAFVYHGKHMIEFTDAELQEGEIRANVKIF